jgi:hypothetical protein
LKYCQQIPKSPDYIELALDVIQPDIDRMLINGIPPEKTATLVNQSVNQFMQTMGSSIEKQVK